MIVSASEYETLYTTLQMIISFAYTRFAVYSTFDYFQDTGDSSAASVHFAYNEKPT